MLPLGEFPFKDLSNRAFNHTFGVPASKYTMAKKKKKYSSFSAAKNLQRKLAIKDGFYDGRFREKTIKDKKKEESRRKARGKVNLKEID